jgi:hypothetical protein
MNKETEKILEKFDGFTDGVRLLMLIYRAKDGGKDNNRKTFRRVSTSQDEFESILDEMVTMKKIANKSYRIYSCVNSRDINKAIRIFKQKQLEADYYDEDSKNGFYLDIKNRWISSLMKPQSKAESSFLIDIDENDDEKKANKIISNLVGRNFKKFKTKNGCHLVTPPFNPNLMKGFEIKKDGLLLLSW